MLRTTNIVNKWRFRSNSKVGIDVILSIEAYDYDFELIGGRIVYNNYFAQTPFFILFLFFSIALGLLGILVIVLF